jgi:nucleotide-binding universal stress UspA family protein
MTVPIDNWRKICCPIDFSEPSREVLRMAVALAQRYQAELLLFHAYPLPGYTLPEGSVVPSSNMLQELAAETDTQLARWQKEAETLGASRVTAAQSIGDPAVEIVEFARTAGADLLVIGTHGRTGLRHAILGSVAERVVRHSPCPVLTIRSRGARVS